MGLALYTLVRSNLFPHSTTTRLYLQEGPQPRVQIQRPDNVSVASAVHRNPAAPPRQLRVSSETEQALYLA